MLQRHMRTLHDRSGPRYTSCHAVLESDAELPFLLPAESPACIDNMEHALWFMQGRGTAQACTTMHACVPVAFLAHGMLQASMHAASQAFPPVGLLSLQPPPHGSDCTLQPQQLRLPLQQRTPRSSWRTPSAPGREPWAPPSAGPHGAR